MLTRSVFPRLALRQVQLDGEQLAPAGVLAQVVEVVYRRLESAAQGLVGDQPSEVEVEELHLQEPGLQELADGLKEAGAAQHLLQRR